MAKRMCTSRARDTYDLTEAELAPLEMEYAPNPHDPSAAPMRLYLISDLEAAAEAKIAAEAARDAADRAHQAAREQYEIEHVAEIAEARQAELQRAEAERQAEEEARRRHQAKIKEDRLQWARARIGKWHKIDRGFEETDSGTGLPPDIWIQILMLLVDDLEPEGVRGVSVICRELCIVRAVCKELAVPTQHVFEHLSSLCPALEGPQELWEIFVRDPFSLKVSQLKELGKVVQIRVSDPKPVLIVNLQEQLGIKQPTIAHASLLAAVKKEKHTALRSIGIGQSDIVIALVKVSHNASVFTLRRACSAHGFLSTESLLREAARRKLIWGEEHREWQRTQAEEAHKRMEEARERMKEARERRPRDPSLLSLAFLVFKERDRLKEQMQFIQSMEFTQFIKEKLASGT